MTGEAPATSAQANRVALGVEYNGHAYHGWQIQANTRQTVQHVLETALSKVADQPIKVICAGRTDAGVHASGQVVHLDTTADREPRAWVRGCNSNLPDDVRVRWAVPVSDQFHARFSALSRRYIYVIYNCEVRSGLFPHQLSWFYKPLDIELMRLGARHLVGEHDFTSYRTVHCQAHSPVRTVEHLNISRCGDRVYIDIKANAFLHHMVRNIAGVLMSIGCGEAKPGWSKEVLEHRDRCLGGVTAPAQGLYLVHVGYPAEFDLPNGEAALPFDTLPT